MRHVCASVLWIFFLWCNSYASVYLHTNVFGQYSLRICTQIIIFLNEFYIVVLPSCKSEYQSKFNIILLHHRFVMKVAFLFQKYLYLAKCKPTPYRSLCSIGAILIWTSNFDRQLETKTNSKTCNLAWPCPISSG